MALPYQPGQFVTLGWSNYKPEQAEKQRILTDIVYAAAYGFVVCRCPTPGTTLSAETVEGRLGQVAEGWNYEASIREKDKAGKPTTRGFDPRTELGKMAQEYLAERLIPLPQTAKPPKPWQPAPGGAAVVDWGEGC